MNNREEFQTIVLAALLHDIGKFWQRSGEPLISEDKRIMPNCCPFYENYYTHLHVLYSGRFIRETFEKGYDLTENIVLYHHYPVNAPSDYRRFAKIIQLADWLSAGERRDKVEDEKAEPSKEPLISIFSILSLYGKGPNPQYLPLLPLTINLGDLVPIEDKSEAIKEDSYSKHWRKFQEEAKMLSKKFLSDFLITQLIYLLQKYTLSIPSATYRDRPDISLYHHLKTTAAIASCLWSIKISEDKLDIILEAIKNGDTTNLQEAPCLIVAGDISGIQDFIYSVTSESALKGIKGRSFYLQLLSEGIAKSIIKKFGLTECNILYSAGGNFYLLLPNLKEIENEIAEIKGAFDKNILQAHRGKLSLNTTCIPVKYEDFLGPKFGEIWQSAKNLLSLEKKKKFSSLLQDVDEISKILGPFEEGGERKVCEICGEELDEGEESPCPLCKSFENLAYDLPRARVMQEKYDKPYEQKGRAKSWDELFSSLGIKFLFLPETAEKENAYLLNSPDFSGKGYAGFRFLAQNAPMIGDNVKTLEEIAKSSDGIKRWAVLRADVDNLGDVFAKGLKPEDKTISRMTMLSEMLSLFFNAQVEKIAREKDFKDNLYVIYSGGDDLFVIGAWSKLPDFLKKLYEDFRSFTAQRLTFSAGIYIAPSLKFPVYQSADNAKDDLELAKRNGKNKLTFLNRAIPWEMISNLEEIKNKIINLLDENGPNIPRSLLQILYQGWLEKERVEKGETSMIRIWRFLYALKRLKERHSAYAEKIDDLERAVMIDKELKPYLDVSIRWAELLTRKEV
uniref:CRISPR system single-strand-specific deoxyribonuclease Cas10/Csm1 (subtype III-A) n=1 Tax=candidate division WOR-3 bacterium TaxID=2052148 RepID=A0A7C6A8A0_UNCW3